MNWRKSVTLILIMIISICSGGQAALGMDDIAAIFSQGNNLYQQGEYEQAIAVYQSILDKNKVSASLYYNLGNCYVKTNQIGRAILHYRRGQLLAPEDADIKANMDFALSLRKNLDPEQKANWWLRLVRRAAGFYSLDSLSLKTSVFYWLAMILFSLSLLVRGRSKVFRKSSAAVGVIGLFFMLILAIKFYDAIICRQAVIVVPEVSAGFAPADDATVHFQLFEGDSIVVVGESQDWLRVKTPDDKIGWVRRASLDLV